MINKNELQSFISKYYLNGINNQVKWRIKDNTLTVYGDGSPQVCKVVLKKFDKKDAELGVFDTHKLNKLISVTSGELNLDIRKQKAISTHLYISDESYDLTYSLADVLILGKQSYYNDPEDGYEVELNLTNEDVDNLIKAKNALESEIITVSINQDFDGNNICNFIFGEKNEHSSQITYQIRGAIKEQFNDISFNSNVFKDILNSNKDIGFGTLKITKDGIMKFNFEDEYLSSEYYITKNE